MNLLTESIVSVNGKEKLSIPALLAAMARDEVRQFSALRPHQRPVWHMFLTQLAALAVWTSNGSEVPDDANDWIDLLRELTPDYADDAPWCLMVENRALPAFLQPPDPGGLKWIGVPTPDDLDILITARNHDIKQSMARDSNVEDWLFALVSLQTSSGFDGRGNYGIARMNGGSSSRPMLGLAPATGRDHRVDPSRWWLRDVRQLLAQRQSGASAEFGAEGGPALLWCLDWAEGNQLDLRTLDPWFVEVSRRVRLYKTTSGVTGERANSRVARVDAKPYKGHVGDPWAPVHRTEGKSLTLGSGDFDYRRLKELMFGGDWAVPALAMLGESERADDRLLVAEALARGNSKTEGFRSRVVPVPANAVPLLRSPAAAELSGRLMAEIAEFDGALGNALALLAAGGEPERIDKNHYAVSRAARHRFDRMADNLFFPHLWNRLAAHEAGSAEAEDEASDAFRQRLFDAARVELEAAMPGIPCTSIARPKAEVRCRRRFHARLHKLLPHLTTTSPDQVEPHDQLPESSG